MKVLPPIPKRAWMLTGAALLYSLTGWPKWVLLALAGSPTLALRSLRRTATLEARAWIKLKQNLVLQRLRRAWTNRANLDSSTI